RAHRRRPPSGSRRPRRPSNAGCESFSSASAEPAAAELAVLEQPDEERVKLLVVARARLGEARGQVPAQCPEGCEPRLDEGPPLVGEILRLDSRSEERRVGKECRS